MTIPYPHTAHTHQIQLPTLPPLYTHPLPPHPLPSLQRPSPFSVAIHFSLPMRANMSTCLSTAAPSAQPKVLQTQPVLPPMIGFPSLRLCNIPFVLAYTFSFLWRWEPGPILISAICAQCCREQRWGLLRLPDSFADAPP